MVPISAPLLCLLWYDYYCGSIFNMIDKLITQEIENIPEKLEDGIIYVSYKYGVAIHRCACGCGEHTVTPFEGPRSWTLTSNPNGITLRPSIGNFQFKCKSHYWITHGIVQFC